MAVPDPAVNNAATQPVPDVLWAGQPLRCRMLPSATASKLRIKVGPEGVAVVLPEGRSVGEGIAFVRDNQRWVLLQLARAERLRAARRPPQRLVGQVLFRGEPVPVKVMRVEHWLAPNKVVFADGTIDITCRPDAMTPPAKSLENWLRKQAREHIEPLLADVGRRLGRTPNRVYVMGQRTKWGNCSALGNLSFNWRLVMAPDEVLRYIVTHEVVHLAVPDHSPQFWLTVQSLCPQADRARQWLVGQGHRLSVDLSTLLGAQGSA